MAKASVNRVEPQQTLVDLAMQDAGHVESLFEVAQLNGKGITEALTPGEVYIKPAVRDASIVKVFSGEGKLPVYGSKTIKPASE